MGARVPDETQDRPARLFLSAIGSLGDVHPILAIAIAARASGAEVTMAVAADHLERARREGIAAVPVLPAAEDLCRQRGITERDLTRLSMRDPALLLREMLVPHLAQSLQALGPAARGHDVIAANFLSLAAPIAAEVLGLPFVPLLMQPPRGPMHEFVGPMFRGRFGPQIDAVRAGVGLGPQRSMPVQEADGDIPVRLGLYPPFLGGTPENDPPGLRMTGFAVYDGNEGDLPGDLAAFLDAGDAPLVVTLGSSARQVGLGFFSESVAAARALGLRSVLLTGKGWQGPARGADFIACAYAPYSVVFPRAAAIVHHAGMGTIGLAGAAGRPQLMVPVVFDQPGNAALAQARGLGQVVPFGQYTAARATQALRALLSAESRARAEVLAGQFGERDGAAVAARALIGLAAARRRG